MENRMVLAVMVALFLASLGAELAGVEKIVGAFLAGLAVNSVLPEGRVKEQVIFLGGVLFIPIFFIDLGLLLDLGSLGESLSDFRFTALMLGGAIGGKGLASWISGKLFGYRRPQILMMWSLTMPKVAATLATAFIGYQAGLLNQTVLNSVLAVMVVTATLGPILTERSVKQLMDAPLGMVPTSFGEEAAVLDGVSEVVQRPLRIVVPVANPGTEQGLLAMAARLVRGSAGGEGLLLPLALVNPSLEELRGGLTRAVAAARTFGLCGTGHSTHTSAVARTRRTPTRRASSGKWQHTTAPPMAAPRASPTLPLTGMDSSPMDRTAQPPGDAPDDGGTSPSPTGAAHPCASTEPTSSCPAAASR